MPHEMDTHNAFHKYFGSEFKSHPSLLIIRDKKKRLLQTRNVNDKPNETARHKRNEPKPCLRWIPSQRMVSMYMGTEECSEPITERDGKDAVQRLNPLPKEERSQCDADAVVDWSHGQLFHASRPTHRICHHREADPTLPHRPKHNGEGSRNYRSFHTVSGTQSCHVLAVVV